MRLNKYGFEFFDGDRRNEGGHSLWVAKISGRLLGVCTFAIYWHPNLEYGYYEDFYDCYHCYFSFLWISLYCGGYPYCINEATNESD